MQNNNLIEPFGEETVNKNGERLIDLYAQHQLKINNGYFEHKYKPTQPAEDLKKITDYKITK